MNRWGALALLPAIAGALALRAPKLATRPLHNDEGVNAVKVTELWHQGRYVYDPNEYHGPTLHYATLPFLWLSGARSPCDLDDATLRLAPVAFGFGLILLLLLFQDGLGRTAVVWAATFTAVSPAMVFYSRYFIHETLLVFFTALTLGAGWRYARTRSPRWAVVAGAGLGLMFATKETFVFAVGAMALAGVATAWWTKRPLRGVHELRETSPPHEPRRRSAGCQPDESQAANPPESDGLGAPCSQSTSRRLAVGDTADSAVCATVEGLPSKAAPGNSPPTVATWKHVLLGASSAFLIWLVLFSSFFTNFSGLLDSVRTYLPWLTRAGGHSPHIHPWSFYLERLSWFHPSKGPVWSEGLILILAAAGAVVSLVGKQPLLHRFLAVYTMTLTGVYCAIPYKTPWCLLGFFHGMIMLAGVGAAALVEFFRTRALKAIAVTVLFAFTAQLAWQAWRASFVYPTDRRNPYVYAQTVPDVLNLVERAEGIARVAPTGYKSVIKIVAPESDYWPLPWYLRRFQHIGWYDTLPEDPFAPMIIVSSKLDARLDEKSDKKWLMVGLFELRPGKFFELYVELALWAKYAETLPRERD